ncbi:MAG TPA: HyaD/HybD family hydrogenase maturation endopeptidase [Chromatiaceae bacterium]|nr:HyaD/HybD family hydrogenase maturation endopeptidase [Chromatiaceae bacterium]
MNDVNREHSEQQHGPRVLLLGIGNLLWADEGFGVRAIEHMHRHYEFPPNVELLDGGTQGIYLVQNIREADILVVFDAVDYGLPGGSLKRIEGDQVPKYLGCKKVSLHQTGFQEVLAMAEMLGDYPEKLLLIGVQPVEIEDFGGSLRPLVKAQIQPAIDLALEYMLNHGVKGRKREKPLQADIATAGSIADMQSYEEQRPTNGEACRLGDERVLLSQAFSIAYRATSIGGIAVPIDKHLEKYRKVTG